MHVLNNCIHIYVIWPMYVTIMVTFVYSGLDCSGTFAIHILSSRFPCQFTYFGELPSG
jgi:hypothetical protein